MNLIRVPEIEPAACDGCYYHEIRKKIGVENCPGSGADGGCRGFIFVVDTTILDKEIDYQLD
jgi:hypothetical protein